MLSPLRKKIMPKFVWDINLQTCLLCWVIQSASKFANPSLFFSSFNKTVDCGSGKASWGNTQYGTSSEICYSVVNWGSFTHENISQTGWKIPKPDAFSEKEGCFLISLGGFPACQLALWILPVRVSSLTSFLWRGAHPLCRLHADLCGAHIVFKWKSEIC